MSIDREAIISKLENARSYVGNPELLMAENQKQELNDSVDRAIRYARYGRYHVTALGVFSTGKSTLLNALLEEQLLPSADLPVTAITTEIYYAEETSFFIPLQETIPADILADFKQGLASFKGVKFTTELTRNGELRHGLGGVFAKHDSGTLYQIISELTSQSQREQQPFLKLKKHLEENLDLQLWLGVSTMPEWLKDIVLTDAPGTGSVDKSHEIIIDKVIPESQLVLFLIESAKAGSAIDKRFCSRISNTYHRKMFCVLNKIDTQTEDEQNAALALAKLNMPEALNKEDEPEYFLVSGLFDHKAHEVASGKCSIGDIVSHPKINLNLLLASPKWGNANGNEKERKRLLAEFLHSSSKFQAFRDRIEGYLRHENKELAIAQQANGTIAILSGAISKSCDSAIQVLASDQDIDTIRQQAGELHQKRLGYQREAENIIGDYLTSELDSETGLKATIQGLLAQIPSQITTKLVDTLSGDKEAYKKLKKKEHLQNWLNVELRYCINDVATKLNADISKRYSHVLERLTPILKKIENATFSNALPEIDIKNKFSPETSNTPQIAGSAMGAFVGGSGAAICYALGIGTVTEGFFVTTTTFWCGLSLFSGIAIAAGTLAIAGFICAKIIFGKKWTIDKLSRETEALLKKIVLTGGSVDNTRIVSIAEQMFKRCDQFLNATADELKKGIAQRLQQLDEEEENLLAQVAQSEAAKEEKINRLKTIRTQMLQMQGEAQKELKKASRSN